MQIVADRIPVLLKTISLRFKEQLLKGTVELPDRLLLIDALIALQPLDGYLDAYGDSFPFHRENLALLATYAGFLRETIERRRSRSVLSLGIGHSIVAPAE